MSLEKTETLFFKDVSDEEYFLDDLMNAVMTGNQERAEKIIHANPRVLLQRGSVTDPAGREFSGITAFQYALWAGDIKHMALMMVECILCTEYQEEMCRQLSGQIEALEQKNIIYSFKGKSWQESHFNLLPLISGLTAYVDDFFNVCVKKRKQLWCSAVGSCQTDLPIYIRQHYCNLDYPFDYAVFGKKKFIRTLRYQNEFIAAKNEEDGWLGVPDGLGRDYAIAGSRHAEDSMWGVHSAKATRLASYDHARDDLSALQGFVKSVKVNLSSLKNLLECPQKSHFCSLI